MLRLGRALKLVWSVAPGWTLASAALTVLQGLLPLAAIWLMKLIVDAVTEGIAATDHSAAFQDIALLIGLAAAVGLVAAIVRSVSNMVDEALSQTVTDHVTDLIHAQSVKVDLEYYEDPRYHDTLYRAQQEAPFRPTSIVKNLTSTGQSLVTLVAMAGLLLRLHWAVGLIVLAAAIPGAIVRFLYSRKLYSWQRQRSETERKSYYAHWLLTDSTRAKEIRLFDLGDHFRGWHRDLRRLLRRERIRLAGRRSLAELIAGVVAVGAIFGTFAYMAWRTVIGAISLGAMVAYYQAFQTSLTALQSVLGGFASLYEDNLFLSYYDEFMQLEPKVVQPRKAKSVPAPISEGVRFEQIRFSYPDTDRTALSDVSLDIRPGEVTALVGPNGSGKTTLVKLLCRLYDPTDGKITLDGIDLRSFDVADLRRHMSVIFQDFVQYQLTARENIHLGNVRLEDNDPAIEGSARDAKTAKFSAAQRPLVEKGLPLQLDTLQRVQLETQVDDLHVGLARGLEEEAAVLGGEADVGELHPERRPLQGESRNHGGARQTAARGPVHSGLSAAPADQPACLAEIF